MMPRRWRPKQKIRAPEEVGCKMRERREMDRQTDLAIVAHPNRC